MAKRKQNDAPPPSENENDSLPPENGDVLGDFEPAADAGEIGDASDNTTPPDVLQDFLRPGTTPANPPPRVESVKTPPSPESPVGPDRIVSISEIPLRRTQAYVAHHMPALSGKYARILRDLTDGLAARGDKLPSGKLINSPDAALRWLLDRLDAGE